MKYTQSTLPKNQKKYKNRHFRIAGVVIELKITTLFSVIFKHIQLNNKLVYLTARVKRVSEIYAGSIRY